MTWNHLDQLSSTARQMVNNGVPETTYYVYDAAGERVRKVTERANPAGSRGPRKSERIYLGGFEVHRTYAGEGTTVQLERLTTHVMDGTSRVAMIERRTAGADGSPPTLVRFQLANHLGSACLELDDQGQIISYEEYYPYGSTSYQAVRSQTEAPKRYRYSGKERDEESGLVYFGARYYATWLGRWLSPDPVGLDDGLNLYWFAQANPIANVDLSGRQATPASPAPARWERGVRSALKDTRKPLSDRVAVIGSLARRSPDQYRQLLEMIRRGEFQDAPLVVESVALHLLRRTMWAQRQGREAYKALWKTLKSQFGNFGVTFGNLPGALGTTTPGPKGRPLEVAVDWSLLSSPEAFASVLAHESVHVLSHTGKVFGQDKSRLLEEEVAAHQAGLDVWKEFGREKLAAGIDAVREREAMASGPGRDPSLLRRDVALRYAADWIDEVNNGGLTVKQQTTRLEDAVLFVEQLFDADPGFLRGLTDQQLSGFAASFAYLSKAHQSHLGRAESAAWTQLGAETLFESAVRTIRPLARAIGF